MHAVLDNPTRSFWLFTGLHVIAWTLLPTMVNGNLPLDVIEALAWGREWEWGYVKHPPLSAWVAEAFGWLSAGGDWGLYLASQLCVAIAFWAMWQLANDVLEPAQAFLSVLLLEGVYYHNFTSPELNVNVVLLACWALTILFFYRATRSHATPDWLLTGLFAGLGFLSKYLVVFLLLPLFLYLLWDRRSRASFKGSGPWLGLLVFLLVAAPHVWWMFNNDFITITYGLRRAGNEGLWLDHIRHPLRFLGAQLAVLLPVVLLLYALGRPKLKPLDANSRFLLVAAIGPLVAFLLLSLITGMRLRSMWGTPLLAVSGLVLMQILGPPPGGWRLPRFSRVWTAWFLFALIAYGAMTMMQPYIKDKGKRTHFAGPRLAQDISQQWHAHFNRPLKIVVAAEWLGGNLGWYGPDRPSIYLNAEPTHAPWMDDARVRREGAVFLWHGGSEAKPKPPPDLAPYRQRFGNLQLRQPLLLPWQTAADISPSRVHWAMLEPADTRRKD